MSDQHVVHHHEDQRNARGFLPGEILRHSQSLARIDERVLREGAAAAPHHAVADLEPCDAFSELCDFAGALSTGGFRGAARLDGVPDDQLAAIQARGVHPREDLPGPGLGHGRVAQLKNGFSGFGADPIRFHFIASCAAPVSRRMCMPVLARSTA